MTRLPRRTPDIPCFGHTLKQQHPAHDWAPQPGMDPVHCPGVPNPEPAQDALKDLVQVGWYCWRCHGINARACRSDAVPIYVPAEWAKDMERELDEKENESGEW